MPRLHIWTLLLVTLAAPSAFADDPLDSAVFDTFKKRRGDLDRDQVLQTLPVVAPERLGFDPTKAADFDLVAKQLKLTPEERAMFVKNGLVSVDHGRRYSFGSSYYAIYARDLPVLITSDSIMHAVHKSYDDILMELETTYLAPTIQAILMNAHKGVSKEDKDVDLYLAVALNLLAGAGDTPTVPSKLEQDPAVERILKKIQALQMETPGMEGTKLYDGTRLIDWSQFRPRGHYTKTEALKRYFRAMMWLGRADTGFEIAKSKRQLGAAQRLVTLVKTTDGLEPLGAMNGVIDFMVGPSDNISAFDLNEAMAKNASPAVVLERLSKLASAKQKIRSQVVVSNPGDTVEVQPPAIFQLFGQRFVIDSFVLSKVVFDSILFKGNKVRRMMPSGLDVMAALGNDQAIRELAPSMASLPYGGNLLAARDYIDAQPASHWRSNVYNSWLAALRTLDDQPSSKNFPRAMRTTAWRQKQLRTQLGSWAELRHDTILYAKQSYTAYPGCSYPGGYVEPYPAFYEAVRTLAVEAVRRIKLANYGPAGQLAARHIDYFNRLAETMTRLQSLATKELAAEAFSSADEAWLKKTIDVRGGGSGPPRYDGWYPALFYGGGERASEWDPTIADVHSDPASKSVLEVGIGDVNFLVVAIDNEAQRRVYVGPSYSFYEFAHPATDRLTDEKWQSKIRSQKQPAQPTWTKTWQGTTVVRDAGR